MSRSLTDQERNKIKNLQVSNSIYRKQIKTHLSTIEELKKQKDPLVKGLPNLLGEEHQKAEREINRIDGEINQKLAKIAYIEARISEKESQVEEIKNKAAQEEEPVVGPVLDASSKEFQEKYALPKEDPEEIKPRKRTPSKKEKKNKEAKPENQETPPEVTAEY